MKALRLRAFWFKMPVWYLSFYNRRIKQEIINIYHEYSLFVIVRRYHISGYYDSLKRILDLAERPRFLESFFFIRQRIC